MNAPTLACVAAFLLGCVPPVAQLDASADAGLDASELLPDAATMAALCPLPIDPVDECSVIEPDALSGCADETLMTLSYCGA